MRILTIILIATLFSSCFKEEVYYDTLGNSLNIPGPEEKVTIVDFIIDSTQNIFTNSIEINEYGNCIISGIFYSSENRFLYGINKNGQKIFELTENSSTSDIKTAKLDLLGNAICIYGNTLLKLDANANFLWFKNPNDIIQNIPNSSQVLNIEIHDLEVNNDGSCIIYCHINYPSGDYFYSLGYTANGEFICSNGFEVSANDFNDGVIFNNRSLIMANYMVAAYDLEFCQELNSETNTLKGFIQNGSIVSKYAIDDKLFITEPINDLGSITNDRTYILFEDLIEGVAQANDGGYLLARGNFPTTDYTEFHTILVKFNSMGEKEWTKHFYQKDFRHVIGLRQISDGSYILLLSDGGDDRFSLIQYIRN